MRPLGGKWAGFRYHTKTHKVEPFPETINRYFHHNLWTRYAMNKGIEKAIEKSLEPRMYNFSPRGCSATRWPASTSSARARQAIHWVVWL
ncbi:Uncharacterized protein HZ326_7815 [Fusarium oxysporum f. sp. albedinis]|nr:Uncharacterized protein HZ326_7815 [Fusarium oxysporum f. sp. albedinis]